MLVKTSLRQSDFSLWFQDSKREASCVLTNKRDYKIDLGSFTDKIVYRNKYVISKNGGN